MLLPPGPLFGLLLEERLTIGALDEVGGTRKGAVQHFTIRDSAPLASITESLDITIHTTQAMYPQ